MHDEHLFLLFLSFILYPSSPMAVAVRSSLVVRDHLAEARQLLQQLGRDFQSPHEIIDLTELDPNFADRLEREYSKFGTQFIFFIREYLKVEQLKVACHLAMEKQEEMAFPWIVQALALAKFGKGGPQAISYLACMAIVNSSPLLVHLGNTFESDFFPDPACRSHTFILLGVSAGEVNAAMEDAGWHTHGCFELLAKKGGVILDLFLKVVSPLSQYETEAKPLLDYVDQWGLYFFVQTEEVQAKDVRDLLKQADTIHEKATKLLPTIALGQQAENLRTFAANKLSTELVHIVTAQLNEMFSDVSWSQKIDETDLEWTLVTRGTQQQLVKILLPLEQWGVPVEMRALGHQDPNAEHELVLKNCYPYGMKLYSYFCAETGQFASPVKQAVVTMSNRDATVTILSGKEIVSLMMSYL